MIRAATLMLALLVATPVGAAELLDVQIGASRSQIDAVLASAGAKVVVSRAVEPQAWANGLVHSKMLVTLNELGIAPLDETKALDGDAFTEILRVTMKHSSWVLTFGASGKLRYAFGRIPVRVDASGEGHRGGNARRLQPLRAMLDEIRGNNFVLSPKEKDHWGNTFTWTGKGDGRARIGCWYVPSEDELRVVLH